MTTNAPPPLLNAYERAQRLMRDAFSGACARMPPFRYMAYHVIDTAKRAAELRRSGKTVGLSYRGGVLVACVGVDHG